MSWIAKARRLRAQNVSYAKIAEAVGVHKSRVHQVLKGSKHIRAPWHSQARAMRSRGASINQIVEATGKAASTVVGVVSEVKCPINHRKPGSEKRNFSGVIANELTSHQRQEIADSVAVANQKLAAAYQERVAKRAERNRFVKIATRIGRRRRHQVKASDILGKSVKANIYRARLEFMAELRTEHRMTTMEIGRVLGHADHTAVLYGLRKVGLNGRLPKAA